MRRMKSKRYWGRVMLKDGQVESIVVKGVGSEAEARDKLIRDYKIEAVLKISDTYHGIEKSLSCMGGSGVKNSSSTLRKRGSKGKGVLV